MLGEGERRVERDAVHSSVIPPRDPGRRLYFVSPWVDAMLIGGASLVTYAGLLLLQGGQRTEAIWQLAGTLVWVCNWPHFSATSYRLYRSRENVAAYPLTALAIPLLVIAAVITSVRSPEGVAPCFVKLFLLWSPYHFSGQTIGITLLYARRAQVRITPWQRRVLSTFVYGTFVSGSARGEIGAQRVSYFGISYPTLGLPPAVATITDWVVALSGVALLAYYALECRRARRVLAPIVLLPAVTQFVWFVPGNRIASYNEFVPFFHALQYLLIAWAMQLKERLDEERIAPSARYVWSETGRWGLLNVLGGGFLFWALPRLVATTGVPLGVATAVVIAGVQIHHFFVDGVIWKLRNPRVASPLSVHLDDLLHPVAA